MLTDYAKRLLAKKATAPRQPGAGTPRLEIAQVAAGDVLTPLPDSLKSFGEFMSVHEVASYFAVSTDAVLLWRGDGLLDFVNIGSTEGRPTYRVRTRSVAGFERRRTLTAKP